MARSGVSIEEQPRRRPVFMLHAGLDLSRKRLDYCLLDEHGEAVERGAAAPDADGLARFAKTVWRRHGALPVCAAIESMNGARFVHDTLERCGWELRWPTPRRSEVLRRWRARPTGSMRGSWPSSPVAS